MEIDKIPMYILGAVRQRFGAVDEEDTQFDERIKKLEPIELVAKWSGWNLGDESWARIMISYYNTLQERNDKPNKT